VPVLAVHLAEVFFPKKLAGGVQAIEAVGAEEGEDALAVGDRRRGCQAGGPMTRLVRRRLVQGPLPKDFACFAANRQYGELVILGQGQIIMGAWPDEAGLHLAAVGKLLPHAALMAAANSP